MDKACIRPIAICLFRNGDRILVSEAYDSAKGDNFCRPLGGGIEFGERSRDALPGFVVGWQSPEEIRARNARLVPEGLADLLSRAIK